MKIESICDVCGQTYLAEKKALNRTKRMGRNPCCSLSCASVRRHRRADHELGFISVRCVCCDRTIQRRPKELRADLRGPYCSIACANISRPRKKNPVSPYLTVKTDEGTKLAHRMIMETHLGRKLKSSEHVHHKDGDKRNNSLSNLVLTTKHKHGKHHRGSRNLFVREQEQAIVTAFKAGVSINELAKRLGCSRHSVYVTLSALGIIKDPPFLKRSRIPKHCKHRCPD